MISLIRPSSVAESATVTRASAYLMALSRTLRTIRARSCLLPRMGAAELEPGVVSVTFYATGVGIVKEYDAAGGNETFELISVTHG